MSRSDLERLAAWFAAEAASWRAQPDSALRSAQVHRVWSALAADPCVTHALAGLATQALRRLGLSPEWRDDIVDDALLRLHGELARDPTLGFDSGRPSGAFAAWLGTIFYRQTRKAARALHRQQRDELPLERAAEVCARRSRVEAIDLAMTLRRLSNAQRAVAHRLAKGDSPRAIAAVLGISRRKAEALATEVRTLLAERFLRD